MYPNKLLFFFSFFFFRSIISTLKRKQTPPFIYLFRWKREVSSTVPFHGTPSSQCVVVLSPLSRASSTLGHFPPPPPPLLLLLLQIHREVTEGQSQGRIGSPIGYPTTTTSSGACLFTLEGRRCWLFSLTAPFRALLLLLMLAGNALRKFSKISAFMRTL
jgi:hypothetical protein